MGDVTTHAQITEFVVAEVRRTISDQEIPEADYTFLELGNFLTDVSQFRDPVAFHRARDAALAQAQKQSLWTAELMGDSVPWAKDVFGQRSGQRHGALPEMMRMLIQALTHDLFDSDGLPVLGAALNQLAPGFRPPLLPAHGIAATEVNRVLQAHYTQYYPHEHLDFPPTRTPLVAHRTDPDFAIGARGLVAYLERFIEYLAQALTQLEAAWVSSRAAGTLTAPQRQDFLVQLGHLLHPIEDYFFHSNLLELHQWNSVRAAHPNADPGVPADLRTLIDGGLLGTQLDPASEGLRRRLFRRLRYPTWTPDSQLSATSSGHATDLVYTGGFGQTDVWHTLGGALEGIESTLSRLPASHDPRNSNLLLFRLLLSSAARKDMVARNLLDEHKVTHRDQLRAGQFTAEIGRWQSRGLICPHTAALLRGAFALDLAISERHKGIIYDFPGPGSVLITMLDTMQRERDAAAAARTRLDAIPAAKYDPASDNTCSDERVGTHSLLSKDSTDKEPMRPEAVALAKHASAGIATTLLNRVYSPIPLNEGVDWGAVLEFFLRGPATAPGTWETELITGLRAAGAGFQQPHVTSVQQQPPAQRLGPGQSAATLAQRRAGTARTTLEAQYQAHESDPG